MQDREAHWEGVYGTKVPTEVSWFQETPRVSLDMIETSGVTKGAWIVDVGGGASTLVDHLWERRFHHMTVLDISAKALEHAKARHGHEAVGEEWEVEWVVGDATLWQPPRLYDLWHDRAVFHFLTGEAERRAYVEVLKRALKSGGQAVIATFALDGPEKCSGLPVRRYSPEMLAAELGPEFSLEDSTTEDHVTPGGSVQKFVYCRFRRN